MIWSSSSIIFQCEFSRDSDYVIRRLYFKILNAKTKIQDKEEHLRQCQGKDSRQGSKTKDNVKAKIQDKEEHLRQCQGKDSRQGSKTKDNVKAKIQE